MHIGIAFDLKSETKLEGRPDDWQEELDSPLTIQQLSDSITGLGHRVSLLGNGRRLVDLLLAPTDPVDMVFNIAEGTTTSRSREALVPAVCQMLQIPCTGSEPSTLGVALDKSWTKRIVRAAGVVVPAGMEIIPGEPAPTLLALREHKLHLFPLIVKPAWEGSSKGIRLRSLVYTLEQLTNALDDCHRQYGQPAMMEEFIDGDDVTVGLLGPNEPWFGAMRILPTRTGSPFIYSLEVKRNWKELVHYESPAQLAPEVLARLESQARKVWGELGLRDISRMDFRIRGGVPIFLEVNPLPGLDPGTGDLSILARGHGMAHVDILKRVIVSCHSRQSP